MHVNGRIEGGGGQRLALQGFGVAFQLLDLWLSCCRREACDHGALAWTFVCLIFSWRERSSGADGSTRCPSAAWAFGLIRAIRRRLRPKHAAGGRCARTLLMREGGTGD